jgi:hypothetical protein
VIKTDFVCIIYNLYRTITIIIIIIIMDIVCLSLHLTAKRTETATERRKWKVSIKNTNDVERKIRNASKTKQCQVYELKLRCRAAEILYIEYIYIIKRNILNIPTYYILSRNISHNNSKRSRIKCNLHLQM